MNNKQRYENCNSFKSNNEFPHQDNINKTPPTNYPNLMGKRNNANCRGFHVLQNRRERTAKANSVKIRNF